MKSEDVGTFALNSLLLSVGFKIYITEKIALRCSAGRFFIELKGEKEVSDSLSHLCVTRIVGMQTVGAVLGLYDINSGLNCRLKI